MKNRALLVVILKKNNGLWPIIFLSWNPLPPHKGDRGGLEPYGTAAGFWNARKALRGRGTPAGLFRIVRWQEILSPSYIISVLLSSGTPSGLWNRAFGSIWNARRGLVKNHYYTRATHGIVEVMWSNRDAFVERGFLSGVPRELCSNGERRRCGALKVSDPGRDFR